MTSTTARGIKYPVNGDPVANLETYFANLAITADTAIANAVAGKANTTHTHAIADVTGLQAALDGKAAATHTHTLAALGIQAGTATIPMLAAGASTNVTVTFPVAFASAPSAVVVTGSNSRLTTTAASVTATSFVISTSNWTSASPGVATSASWVAVK